MLFGSPGFGSGFVVGFASGFVSRELAMVAMAVVKPLTKSVIKAGVVGVEKTKESLAYLKESFDDMIAEVREGMEMQEPAEEELIEGESKKKASHGDTHKRERAEEHRGDRLESEKSEVAKVKPQHKGTST